MKLLILSDTHDNYSLAIKALERAGDIDQIIHLGDGEEDARIIEDISGKPVIMVAGNCDLNTSNPKDILQRSPGRNSSLPTVTNTLLRQDLINFTLKQLRKKSQ